MTLQIALDLARNGYYVHPLAPCDKMPLAGGNGSNDATRDEDVIRAWWEATPDANIGISLDKSGLVDIAPDCPEWAAQFKANGLPRTLLYTSNSAWHTWYRLPPGGPVARINISKQYDIMSQGNAVAPGSMHPSGKAYTLHTPLMPVENLPLAPAWAVEMLQARISVDRNEHTPEDWAALPSGAVLAHSRRFQALCKANDQLRAVCAGEAVTLAGDSSISVQRAVFINQLLRAKFPHNEIRALAQHFAGVLESSPKWFTTDIDRLLFKYTPQDYRPESTGVIVQALRGGRHYEITAGELLDRYHGNADCGVRGIVLEWSVSEAADRLGVSTGTIKRRETELIAAGHIRREYGRVILSPDTWEIGSQRSVMPQIEETIAETVIGSQFDMPHQDAPEVLEIAVCEDQACDRNNTLPLPVPSHAEPPLPAAPPRDLVEPPSASLLGPSSWSAVPAGRLGECVLSECADPEAAFWATAAADIDDGTLGEWFASPDGALLYALATGANRRDIETHMRQFARDVGARGWYLRDYTALSERALHAEARRLMGMRQPPTGRENRTTLITSPPPSRIHRVLAV